MRMKDQTNSGDQTPLEPAARDDHRAPGKVTATGGLGGPVQRSAAPDGGGMASPPRGMSDFVPISCDVSFLDSIVSPPHAAPSSSDNGAAVQRRDSGGGAESDVHSLADAGTSGAAGRLPFMDQIQASFGAHDVSGIRAHNDGNAADAARSMGATAFATGDHVAFAGAPDLHTAAHEAAHVVQQRSGVQLYGGVGEVGDRYEQHADAVAEVVVRGESAESLLSDVAGTGPGPSKAIQRFAAHEHRDLGNAGSGGASVELAPGYSVPFGDVVALAGDHFESMTQLRNFAANDKGGKESRAEIEYARAWQLNHPNPMAFFDTEAVDAQQKRYYKLAGRNQSHFLAPNERDRGATPAEMSGVGNDRAQIAAARYVGSLPKNAPAAYRLYHIQAIFEAVDAAKAMQGGKSDGKGPTLSTALATEAFACHFLTDSFSGGHVRTARQDLKSHWDPKVPMFSYNLIGLMSDLIAEDLDRRPIGAGGTHFLAGQARNTITSKLAAKGTFTIGDLIAGALHDHDNAFGVHVKAGGVDAHLVGDGKLDQGTVAGAQTFSLASRAVANAVGELQHAFSLGMGNLGAVEIIELFLKQHHDRFAAETLVPDPTTIDESKSPEAKWRVGSIETLLTDDVFVHGVKLFLNAQRAELVGIAESIGKEFLGGAKEAAIKDAVVKEIDQDPIGVLRRVVNWTPGSGLAHSWHAKDDQSDYVDEAAKHGMMGTLTIEQRISMMKTLTADLMHPSARDPTSQPGTPKVSEARPSETIMSILDTTSPQDVATVFDAVGYDEILHGLTALHRIVFKTKYPRPAHASR